MCGFSGLVSVDRYCEEISTLSVMYTSSGENTSSLSSVPAFLTKLWTLVEDPATDELICWDAVSVFFYNLTAWTLLPPISENQSF